MSGGASSGRYWRGTAADRATHTGAWFFREAARPIPMAVCHLRVDVPGHTVATALCFAWTRRLLLQSAPLPCQRPARTGSAEGARLLCPRRSIYEPDRRTGRCGVAGG